MTASIELWRSAAVALCEYACGYDTGRGKDDPIYMRVTEGRDIGAMRRKYSSCADLAHWLYERLGLRENWINRASLGGWIPGVNVSRLAACDLAKRPKADWTPRGGDVLIVWNTGTDAHVMVALGGPKPDEPGSYGGKLRTANYGAGGMSATAWPGARIGASQLVWTGKAGNGKSTGAWKYSTKIVQRYIDLEDAVELITAKPDFTGAALTGEELDALEYE